jgi:hypothetical protein
VTQAVTQPWTNWAGTESVTPRRVVAPRGVDEVATAVRDAVRDGLRVKAIGSGHSFTGAAVAPGVQLLPDHLDGVLSVDRDSGLVTVEAGLPLHGLNPMLADHGLAPEILGDIDRQTIAGAVSTGTHGSGEGYGSISTQLWTRCPGGRRTSATASSPTSASRRCAGSAPASPPGPGDHPAGDRVGLRPRVHRARAAGVRLRAQRPLP